MGSDEGAYQLYKAMRVLTPASPYQDLSAVASLPLSVIYRYSDFEARLRDEMDKARRKEHSEA